MNMKVEKSEARTEPRRVKTWRCIERVARTSLVVGLGFVAFTCATLAFFGPEPWGTTARGVGIFSALVAITLFLMVLFRWSQPVESWLPVGRMALAGALGFGITYVSAIALSSDIRDATVWGVYGLCFLALPLICIPITEVCKAVLDEDSRNRAAAVVAQQRAKEQKRLEQIEAKLDELLAQHRRRRGTLSWLWRR